MYGRVKLSVYVWEGKGGAPFMRSHNVSASIGGKRSHCILGLVAPLMRSRREVS